MRLLPDVYRVGRDESSALDRAMAGWCWSDGAGVLAGWSAAAVLGSRWVPAGSPSEVVVGARQVKPNPLLLAWH